MTSESIIRGLPHFVKPDEDRIAQLRDLEEYIAEGHGQKWIVEIARRARGRNICALGVEGVGQPTASVDVSEIPAHRGRPIAVISGRRVETSGSDEEVFEARSRGVNARSPWATASRMGSDAATVITIGQSCPAHTSRRPRMGGW
jgi:hypothetical protein